MDKLMQDLKKNDGIKRTSSNAEWSKDEYSGTAKEKIMQTLSTYVPNSWWEAVISIFKLHPGAVWEQRLPGGFHYIVSKDGNMEVHQDYHDVTSDPSKVILHKLTEVPKKNK